MGERLWAWPGARLVVACAGALLLVAGCSGGANPIDRLKARVQLKEGNLSYLAGRYEDAIQSYDRALRHVPRLAPACLNRAFSQEALSRAGSSLEERQRFATEAVSSFGCYLDLIDRGGVGIRTDAPGRERIGEHILTLLVESQQIDAAVAHLQERYARNPQDASALELLSRLEIERGRFDEALQWQRKRVESEPQNPDARYSLGAVIWLMSYRDAALELGRRTELLDEGMESLRQALALRPDDFETLIYVNLMYLEKAKYSSQEDVRRGYEAQAKALRDRALALRNSDQEQTPAAADTAGQVRETP